MSLLSVALLEAFFKKEKETALFGRWIRLSDITPLILKHEKNTIVKQIGSSEQQRPIYSIQLGTGKKKIRARGRSRSTFLTDIETVQNDRKQESGRKTRRNIAKKPARRSVA